MRGQLAVRIDSGSESAYYKSQDRHVTKHVSDLRFTETAPGGHHSASMRISLPRDTFPDLGPADKVYVYDARTGRTVWEGYTENPGSTNSEGVEGFDLAAMGGQVLASDQSEKLIYVDRSLDRWVRDPNRTSAPSAATEQWTNPTSGLPCMRLQFIPGQPVTTGYQAAIAYREFVGSGMEVGAFYLLWDSGVTDTNYNLEAWLGAEPTYSAASWTFGVNASTAGGSTSRFVGDSNFPTGSNILGVRLHRDAGGATNIATDDAWFLMQNPYVLGRRYGADGQLVSGAGGMVTIAYVRADWVATDLLTRVLGATCDRASAVIEAATHQIDQFTFLDGANAQQVFDDLALYEPDMLWEILETNASGKHRFNYRKWPTEPRYEISTRDGYEAPGGEVDLCNRIAVYWTDTQGNKVATVVTATVPELGARIRDAEPVTLPDGMGSATNAQRIGEQVLASKNNPPKAARATVTGPILDRKTGNMVMPWEIRAGYVVRVRETGDDLRCTEREYVDSDHAAYLTLGEPMLTIDQRLANLSGRRR